MEELIKKRIKELEEELDRLDTSIFYIDMIDRWDSRDEQAWNNLHAQYKAVKEEIEILEKDIKKI